MNTLKIFKETNLIVLSSFQCLAGRLTKIEMKLLRNETQINLLVISVFV